MCYIDGAFDPVLRHAEPGTEELVILDNPTKLFGDREMEAAELEFRHGTFAAASRRFESVAKTSPAPARARFGRDLANVYQAWCDLDFQRLKSVVTAMRLRLKDGAYRCDPALNRRIREQLDFLDALVLDLDGEILALNFFLLGKHYAGHGRHEFAALLYYRTLESVFALRLAKRGFSCSDPDWSVLDADTDKFTERYRALTGAVFGSGTRDLPSKVGMVDGALLLRLVDDPFIKRFGLAEVKALRHLRSMTEARNRSVLAHGSAAVSPELSGKFGNFALRALQVYWWLAERGRVDDDIAELRFVADI